MKRIKQSFHTSCLFLIIVLTGCSHFESDPEPSPMPATEILEIRITPYPVPAGEVATITCVNPDSSSNELLYRWLRPGQDTSTTVNHIQWRAPLEAGINPFTVTVFWAGEEGSKTPASRQFSVEVTQ